MRRMLCALAAVAATLAVGAPAAQSCSEEYTGACGPSFVLPAWGDAGGWSDPEQFQTIQLAEVDGDGADELLGRGPSGLAIHTFDETLGQWRPQVNGANKPIVLGEFANPPPLTAKDPKAKKTDWRAFGPTTRSRLPTSTATVAPRSWRAGPTG